MSKLWGGIEMICEICGERSGCGDYHETCQCDNKICDNLSRSFEDRFCCIECADYHDNVIDLDTYYDLISYYQKKENFDK